MRTDADEKKESSSQSVPIDLTQKFWHDTYRVTENRVRLDEEILFVVLLFVSVRSKAKDVRTRTMAVEVASELGMSDNQNLLLLDVFDGQDSMRMFRDSI